MFFLLIILLVRIPSDTFVFARELHQALTQPARQDQNGIKTVQCNSGVGLVEAFADPTVQTALIVADIVLSASDFAARASPIRLERNFTILGAYAPKEQWVLLDFSYIRGRVVLSPGVTFSLSQLVIDGVRKGPYFQVATPGMDIIIYMPKDPTMPYAYVLAYNCAYIQRTCLPDSVILASSGSIRRPTEVQPGKQLSDRLPLWQPCDPDPKAHALRRCWPKIGMYFDQAGYGADLVGPGDSPMPNNYIIWTYQVYYLYMMYYGMVCPRHDPDRVKKRKLLRCPFAMSCVPV
ncbi:hypothetical protein VOLCADRAFT_100140 [Volvox carteri f. nagariensis]|uniref:Uncharacterized protein n=1 Tax=Volvox carteri f. nagariensis TaxID=3068 RepID=D8UJI4_VOLCA|nr:uncharacterized protein VOLCADRAFT_100140 [Volvox carteri f. nagariensis]EFJ40129.1 hypothetical protein VOLCADRAFT_100140 [Volvox carteri f. nagariensis]|eukprot:XP_002958825.1 hypothetical protein VOLCADRAFT_100140 [Volvox carteri f. nagariensis]